MKKSNFGLFVLLLAIFILGIFLFNQYKNYYQYQIISQDALQILNLPLISNNSVILNNSFIRLGILSDIHGNADNLELFLKVFKANDVDIILVPGDNVQAYDDLPDEKELESVLSLLSATELPVLIIPGNHEKQSDYYQALQNINKTNIIDMTKIRRVDLNNFHVSIISLPGYNVKGFVSERGFFFDESEFVNIRKLSNTQNKKILLSHQIPKSIRKNGIDVTYKGEHVGDEMLANLMANNNLDISVGSHIHEAGGQAETRNGLFVPQDEYSETLYLNPGAVTGWKNNNPYTGMAAILFVNSTHAAYRIALIK